MLLADINFWAAILVGLIFPTLALYNGDRTRQWLLQEPDKKVYVFRLTVVQLCVLALIALIPFWIHGRQLNVMGLGFIQKVLSVTGLLGTAVLGWAIISLQKMTLERARKIKQQYERIQFLLPTNKKEYHAMIWVSFAAGICEEIVYRGFLFWFLTQYVALIPAVILANVPFALAHLTSTGPKNTMGAFVLGLVFTGIFLITRSLWLPILLHILVDIYSAHTSYQSSIHLDAEEV